ncbi:MAG: hypothetical protein NTZ42_04250 [Candidatus Gribaldobacteria bacterium]|nr:hypothetical protein [Candidatus Gribaldobacteria bacterium]
MQKKTENGRKKLAKFSFFTKKSKKGGEKMMKINKIRVDCNGNELSAGDTVEVVKEENERAGNPAAEFCSVGKQGKVEGPGAWAQGVNVKFPDHESVGCYTRNLKKV